jgi:hypothetical protein
MKQREILTPQPYFVPSLGGDSVYLRWVWPIRDTHVSRLHMVDVQF